MFMLIKDPEWCVDYRINLNLYSNVSLRVYIQPFLREMYGANNVANFYGYEILITHLVLLSFISQFCSSFCGLEFY